MYWPNRISNTHLWTVTNQRQIHSEVLRRKWRWIGHALRRPPGDVTRNAIDWNPQDSRRRGRPAHTWRRQLDIEASLAGKSWNEIKNLASNRNDWKSFVEALCSL
ncbi:uncharacterized protein LOC135959808 [Calliphora vicina]|uniref:uncharacterized protein LOC135959808 n=1 Tax=Calliphora vicina TaxID=7373 RepID=UPI00325BB393